MDTEPLKIKSCPLCGANATVLPHVSHGKTRYSIYCRGCDVETSDEYRTPTEVITAWNTRPGEAALQFALTITEEALEILRSKLNP